MKDKEEAMPIYTRTGLKICGSTWKFPALCDYSSGYKVLCGLKQDTGNVHRYGTAI